MLIARQTPRESSWAEHEHGTALLFFNPLPILVATIWLLSKNTFVLHFQGPWSWHKHCYRFSKAVVYFLVTQKVAQNVLLLTKIPQPLQGNVLILFQRAEEVVAVVVVFLSPSAKSKDWAFLLLNLNKQLPHLLEAKGINSLNGTLT